MPAADWQKETANKGIQTSFGDDIVDEKAPQKLIRQESASFL